MTHDVFISYSSKDKTVAGAACASLEAQNIRCWMAPRDIRPSDEWAGAIINAINSASAFVLVFSANANASSQIRREVERAINRGIPVIPLRIENVVPTETMEFFLSTPHWLDAYTPPMEEHLRYLADVIRSVLHKAPPVPPPPTVLSGSPASFSKRKWGIVAVAVLAVIAGVYWYMASSPQPPTPQPPPAGAARLRNDFAGPSKCLDIVNDGENTKLDIAACGDYSGQYWMITPDGAGHSKLQTQFTGNDKCLDVINDGENRHLTMAACGQFTGQTWTMKSVGNGRFQLSNEFTGSDKCLDVINDGNNNTVGMLPCGNFSGQSWSMDK